MVIVFLVRQNSACLKTRKKEQTNIKNEEERILNSDFAAIDSLIPFVGIRESFQSSVSSTSLFFIIIRYKSQSLLSISLFQAFFGEFFGIKIDRHSPFQWNCSKDHLFLNPGVGSLVSSAMGPPKNDGKMEGWLYLIRSNRFGLQYSKKRFFVLQDDCLKSFKSVPVSEDEVRIYFTRFNWELVCVVLFSIARSCFLGSKFLQDGCV